MTGWNIDLPTTMYFGPGYTTCPYTGERLENIIREVAAERYVAIDTETTGLVNWRDIPLYWSLAWGTNRRATLNAELLPYFMEAFADSKKDWILANAKYDAHILANVGINLAGRLNCVQVMHSLLYEDKPHRLKFIAQHILGWTWADFQDTFGKIGKKQSAEQLIKRAESENFNLLVEYAANDAWGTLLIFHELRKQLESSFTHSLFSDEPPYINTLWDYFHKIEVPFTKVLWKMERRGILIDVNRLEKARPEAEAEINRIGREIVKTVGRMLNINSTPQMREYFIDELGLEPLRKTKGGKTGVQQASVDSEFLEHYKNEVLAAELVLTHREYSKLHGTYLVGLLDVRDPNGRIHSTFNQDVARTGRLSSSNPNLQNIPRPENDKWGIREAFITTPGNKILAADYSQLEMRLLSAAAMEESMIDIFRRGWDIHQGNASLMFDIEYEHIDYCKNVIDKKIKKGELTPEEVLVLVQQSLSGGIEAIQNRYGFSVDGVMAYVRECLKARNDAKSIGFGLNYGMGAGKLSKQINSSLREAQDKIRTYKETYPAVDRFFTEAVEEGKKYGYAFTVLGRRRNIPMISSYRKDEQALGERLAVNTQIQGSAADVTKMAQLNLDAMALDYHYGAYMLLQIHDELVFEAPEETTEEVKALIEDMMAHPFTSELACPLTAEAGVGNSWGQAK